MILLFSPHTAFSNKFVFAYYKINKTWLTQLTRITRWSGRITKAAVKDMLIDFNMFTIIIIMKQN